VLFAVDSSADTKTNWPNGTALRATLARSEVVSFPFPQVPDAETFINLGLNQRPTFFGCNESAGPLVVYLPNAPYTYHSNVSTFDLEYDIASRDAIIRNALNGATSGNSTLDTNWSSCVACAVLARSFDRSGGNARPAACRACYDRYCWNGTVDSRPVGTYEPNLIIGLGTTSDGVRVQSSISLISSSIAALVFILLLL
jgi:lysophospholipase